MRLFQKVPDGGPDSGVTAYVLVEIKPLFSIMLLNFKGFAPIRYHTHAFNAWTFWLRGRVVEYDANGPMTEFKAGQFKYTPREKEHQISSYAPGAWALTFRGPWRDWWTERKYDPQQNKIRRFYLTHGRKSIDTANGNG